MIFRAEIIIKHQIIANVDAYSDEQAIEKIEHNLAEYTDPKYVGATITILDSMED